MIDFEWVELDHVIETNERLVRISGEAFFLRDQGALEMALKSPVNHHIYNGENDVVRLATRYIASVCDAHAFEQGNKRSAYSSGAFFLIMNGYNIKAPDVKETATKVLRYAKRDITETDLHDYIDHYTVEMSDEEIAHYATLAPDQRFEALFPELKAARGA